jgi:DNA-binding CsgD family transcriptional regulator
MEIANDCGQLATILVALCTTLIIAAGIRNDWATMDKWAVEGGDEAKYGQIARNWRLHYLYFQARARWHAGDLEALRRTYDAAMVPNPYEAPASASYRSLIRGTMRLAERSYAQAEQAFRDAVREEDAFKVTRAVASGKVMLSYVLLTRGQTDEAMEVFTPYLKESEHYNIPGQVMRENPIVQPLLRHAHERNIQRPFVEKVLEAMGSPLNALETVGGAALSEREMEVLRVLAEGLGNREIGERLFVSEATVKTHVQRILRKLDAGSRAQAVTRARELMLI